MWSSEPRLARRRFGKAALAVLPLLAGCNLRPIYGRAAQEGVRPELAAIEIVELGGRRGQYFRNYLIDELNPGGLMVPAAYTLEVRLRQEQTALAIQLDNTATRYNLVLGADFALKRRVDAQVIYSSASRRVVSYNVRSNPFGTLVAEQDAERRASREVARQIRTMLSLYFAEQAA
jgi:LPS-assembly lipoprotein